MTYSESFLAEVVEIARQLDCGAIEKLAATLRKIRDRGGRLFILGIGGSAANASHAVNDFRKIAGLECYAPTDNVSELTAWINDSGWDNCFAEWLKESRLQKKDGVLIFSVGGGNQKLKISLGLLNAAAGAKKVGATVLGILGRDGGATAKIADCCVLIPQVKDNWVTAQTEAFQAVIWHLLVTHPLLKRYEMKWETIMKKGRS